MWQLTELATSINPWYFDDPYDGTFWSAIYMNRRIMDVDEISYPISAGPKMNFISLIEKTRVLKRYNLSTFSINRMQKYHNLTYKIQDGRTHIWMNDDIVVKLSFDAILAEHEIQVMKMGISGIPKLIDHWVNNDEYFIVMENCGRTLGQTYVFDVLIPENIRKQMENINKTLKSSGLKHSDPHLNNWVISQSVLNNNKVTMIDMEVVVNLKDAEAYKTDKKDHKYVFPIEYYKTIYSYF